MNTTATPSTATPVSREQLSDEQLFHRFRSHGDLRAYEVLVHRYEQPLFGYLHRYLGSAELAEDVFQATFLRLYVKSDCFKQGRTFRPWIYAIATHKGPYRTLIDSYRWLYGEWLPASGHELGDAPCFEQYVNNPQDTPEEELLTAIHVPLK